LSPMDGELEGVRGRLREAENMCVKAVNSKHKYQMDIMKLKCQLGGGYFSKFKFREGE
jgi:hypothetical protein